MIASAGVLVMTGVRVFAEHHSPAWLAIPHDLLAAAALTLLLLAAFTVGVVTHAVWSRVRLVLAALGGMFLTSVIRRNVSCCPNRR